MSDHRRLRRLLGLLVDALREGREPPAEVLEASAAFPGAAGALPPPPWPEGLVGRPCAQAPALWVAERLAEALGDGAAPPATGTAGTARLLCLARLLAHYFGAEEPRHRPAVSVVIAVYNNADMIGDAIASCLDQADETTEVVVVDDGSTDDIDGALAPFAGRIELVRQVNKGVSAARRAGIEAARGDLVHFLDADDMLLDGCIAAKAAAFAAVPDASLCYGGIVGYDPDSIRPAFAGYDNPTGGPLCPTRDYAEAVARRLPFLPSTVMMPRWLLLDLKAFHEGLRTCDDIRLWFQLAVRRPKVVGLIGKSTLRRYWAGSHGQTVMEPTNARATAALLNICEIVADPGLWHNAFHYISAQRLGQIWEQANSGEAPQLDAVRRRLLGLVSGLGDGVARDRRSPLPLLAMILAALRFLADEEEIDRPGREYPFHRKLEAAARAASRTAAPLTDADVAAWLQPGLSGVINAGEAIWLARLIEGWSAERDGEGMVGAVDLLRHLANPAFDPAAYPAGTLDELRSRAVRWASLPAAPARPGAIAALRAFLPGGGRRRSLELIDGLLSADTVAARRAIGDDRSGWRHLAAVAAGRPGAGPHAERLRSILSAGEGLAEVRRGRRLAIRWHAKALARALGSTERRHAATAALIVAAGNADADALTATVTAGLSQSCGAIDVMVVGDDRGGVLSAALAPFAGRVRLIHAVAPDIGAAWNTAIHHCHADFVLIAGPGEIPGPGCIAGHLERLDANRSTAVTWDRDAWEQADAAADEVDLMTAVAAGTVPRCGCWGAPHWLLLEIGPFDSWLETAVPERYMQRLAMHGAIVALVAGADVDRAKAPTPAPVSGAEQAMLDMLGLADLFDRAGLWPHLEVWTRRMRAPPAPADTSRVEAILLRLVRERLDRAIARLGAARDCRTAAGLALRGLEACPPADRPAGLEEALRAMARDGDQGAGVA